MSAFNLLDNPFAVIGVSLHSTRTEISDAIEDALFTNDTSVRQRELDNARQAVFAPRKRIDAEIAFLPGCENEATKEVLDSLRSGTPSLVIDGLSGVARANYLAHRCASGDGQLRARTAKSLSYAYDDASFDRTLAELASARAKSGFGQIDSEVARTAYVRLRERHADAALDALLAAPSGLEDIAGLAEELAGPQTGRCEFLAVLVNQYEARLGADIEKAAFEVQTELAKLDDTYEGEILGFERSLERWDRLAQPLQVADSARGIDEPHSKELFGTIREHCLDLCNNKQKYALALNISKIVQHVFSELPDSSSLIHKDISDLEELVELTSHEKDLTPLRELVDDAGHELSTFGKNLRRLRTSTQFTVIAESLDFILSLNKTIISDRAAAIVRGLAIRLANEAEDSAAALKITNLLCDRQENFSWEVSSQLEEDKRVLQNNVEGKLSQSMTSAPSLSTINGCGFTLYGKSDIHEDASYLTTYYFVLLFLPIFPIARYRVISNDGRRYSFLGKAPLRSFDKWHLFVACAAVLIAILTMSGNSGGNTSSSSERYVEAQPEAESFAENNGSSENSAGIQPSQMPEVAVDTDTGEESAPPLYSAGATFTRPQIRYCMMQKARLQAANDAATQPSEAQAREVNSAIDDYNSRCSSFRYHDEDMSVIRSEVAQKALTLKSEGEAMVSGGY